MTLYQIINTLKEIALTQPNIKSATDGSIYEVMDTNPSVKYNVVHFSQTTHQSDEDFDYYGFNIFYVSRLEDSLEDNRLQIQSIGIEVLENILRTFCENWNIDFPTITYTPFTQKFQDLCAGVYCNVRLAVPEELICADDYTAEIVPGSGLKLEDVTLTITQNGLRVITPGAEYDGIGEVRIVTEVPQSTAILQDKEVEYTENGSYMVYPDAGYDGMTSVSVDVDVPSRYDEGYEDGVEDQKAKLTSISISANGEYNRADGYSAITVDVPQDEGYEEGYADGQAAQKAKLISTAVTTNGTYSREDGYSSIEVNVPDRYDEGFGDGEAAQKAKLTVTSFTENDTYTKEDGWSAVTVNVPDRYQEGYQSGYTDGINYQKSLLASTSFTYNDTYTRANGWSAVTVNVPDRDLIANLQGDYFIIPSGTTSLRPFAFYHIQTNFTNIDIPNTVTSIGDYAFSDTSLTGITIPGSVTSLGEYCFEGSSAITEITFEGLVPPTINTANTFGSTAYTYPIYVPCQSIDAYKAAFGVDYAPRIQCIEPPVSNFRTIEMVYSTSTANETITLFVGDAQTDSSYFFAFFEAIDNIEIDGVVYFKNESHIAYRQADIAYYWQQFATPGLHTVKYYVSRNPVIIKNSYWTGTGHTFYPGSEVLSHLFAYDPSPAANNLKLVSANIGDGYEAIGTGVFYKNAYLSALTIPSSVTEIGEYICQSATSLTAVTINAVTPPTLLHPTGPVNVFDNTALQYIYVPAESVETYKSAAGWSKYANKITAITND